MNKRQLEYFLEVYRCGNFQTAADNLFVSRQGVSKLVNQLEAELKQVLFERTAHGLRPTDFAVELYPKAQNIIDEYADILGMNTLASQSRQLVTVYALDHLLAFFSTDFLLELKKQYPEIILSFVDTTDEAALEGLAARKCTFGIVTGPLLDEKLQAEKLFFSAYSVRLHKNHPLAARKYLTDDDLGGQKIISKGRAYRCFRHHINRFLQAGVDFELIAETADETIIQQLILQQNALNLGYAYADYVLPHPDIVSVPFWTKQEQEKGQYLYLVYNEQPLTKAARCVRSFILEWVKRYQKEEDDETL